MITHFSEGGELGAGFEVLIFECTLPHMTRGVTVALEGPLLVCCLHCERSPKIRKMGPWFQDLVYRLVSFGLVDWATFVS